MSRTTRGSVCAEAAELRPFQESRDGWVDAPTLLTFHN